MQRVLEQGWKGDAYHVGSARCAVLGVAFGVGRVVDALDAQRRDLIAQGFGQLRANAGSHIADFRRATGEDERHVAADRVLHAEHESAGFGDVVLDIRRHES